MEKIIAVDKRFSKLIQELVERGYRVVDLYQQDIPVNACIYYDKIRDFQNINLLSDAGVLMINGKDKTIDDLEFIINRGIYSSLF